MLRNFGTSPPVAFGNNSTGASQWLPPKTWRRAAATQRPAATPRRAAARARASAPHAAAAPARARARRPDRAAAGRRQGDREVARPASARTRSRKPSATPRANTRTSSTRARASATTCSDEFEPGRKADQGHHPRKAADRHGQRDRHRLPPRRPDPLGAMAFWRRWPRSWHRGRCPDRAAEAQRDRPIAVVAFLALIGVVFLLVAANVALTDWIGPLSRR